MTTRHVDPDDPEAPIHRTSAPPPAPDAVRQALRGVIDPELRADVVELDMVRDVEVGPDGAVTVGVALTTAGCPLRSQIKAEVESKVAAMPGVTDVRVEYSEMTAEQKRAVMQRARWNAREQARPTEVSPTTRVLAVASGKGGVGKSSVTVNLATALAAQGRAVGVLDADVWGFSVPRMLGVDGRLGGADGMIHPHQVLVPPDASFRDGRRSAGVAGGRDAGAESTSEHGVLKVVSMGLLVDDEGTALMWRGLILAKAVEEFLVKVRWDDLDYLLIDMPPGTGDIQMALARLLPQAEMLVVTTPARAAQKVAVRVADMAHRSYMKVVGVVENMSRFVTPDGSSFAVFGEGGGAALADEIHAPLVGEIPLEPAVSEGGDRGRPVVHDVPESAAAQAFRDLAARVSTELLPPIEMAGCTARIFEFAEAKLGPAPAK
jgi:ATP-binding protein involved in chromosome partitioning